MTRRKELDDYINRGLLRQALEYGSPRLSEDAIDLVVDICSRYCEPRRTRRRKPRAQPLSRVVR